MYVGFFIKDDSVPNTIATAKPAPAKALQTVIIPKDISTDDVAQPGKQQCCATGK